jgi:hypothetical protein
VPLQQQRAARARAIVLATLQDNVAAFGRWAARPIDRAAPLAASATPASQACKASPSFAMLLGRSGAALACRSIRANANAHRAGCSETVPASVPPPRPARRASPLSAPSALDLAMRADVRADEAAVIAFEARWGLTPTSTLR